MALETVDIDFNLGGNVDSEGKKVEDRFDNITDKAKKMKDELKSGIAEQKKSIKQIERNVAEVEKLLERAVPGKAKDALLAEQEQLKKSLEGEKAELKKLEGQLEDTNKKYASFRTQIMLLREELARMEAAGLRDTEEYRKQAAALAALADQYADTAQQVKVLADDERGFKAAAGGLTALSGALSAGVGAASLFGVEQEKLALIQTRLQSVMAISIGMQQVAEQINKDSYFSVVLLTKAKIAWATATESLAASLNLSSKAAQRLMLSGIGVLIAGVSALIIWLNKLSKAQRESARLSELAAESYRSAQATGSKSATEERTKLKLLYQATQEANRPQRERIRAARELQKLYPDYLGKLSEEQILAGKGATAYTRLSSAILAAAQARARQDRIVENENKKLDNESKIAELEKKKAEAKRKSDHYSRDAGNVVYGGEAGIAARASQGMLTAVYETQVNSLSKEIETLKTENEALDAANKALAESIKATDLLFEGGGEKAEKAARQRYDAAKELSKQIADLQQRNAQMELDRNRDNLDKRIKQIDLEESEELRRIREKEEAIVEAYNAAHKDKKGFKKASTLADTDIDPKELAKFESEKSALIKSYQAKRLQTAKEYGEETLRLAAEFADRRVKIEKEHEDKAKALRERALELDREADKEQDETRRKALQAQAAYARAAAEAALREKDKQVSDATAGMILESKAYRAATDEKLKLNRQLTKSILEEVKKRVAAEIAAGKLTKEKGQEIINAVTSSRSGGVEQSLGGYIKALKDLKQAKKDLNDAKDVESAKKAQAAVENNTQAVNAYAESVGNAYNQAMFYADQAVKLLRLISKEEGDAADAAANSIESLMDIASATMQGYQQGGEAGAAVAFITSTLTQVFEAEKAHQEALRKIAEAKADTQEAYNRALMRQNELLEKAQSIAGTDAYGQANAYARQVAAFRNASYKAAQALRGATVKTGSEKTGLFGWGGEKAVYSSLLSVYPKLIDGQGRLNKELAKSVLENEQLQDSSKKALQSALDYAEEYEEALKNLEGYLSEIFGGLGADLMSAITSNLDSAKDAVDDFRDHVGEAMKKLVSDIAYSVFFADMFSDFSAKVKAIYASTSLTDTQKVAAATLQMQNLLGSVEGKTQAAQDFINSMYRQLSDKLGVDLSASKDAGGEASGLKGDVAKMTEETGSALVGQITAMRLNVAAILAANRSGIDLIGRMLGELAAIRDHSASSSQALKEIHEILVYHKNHGIKVQ